MPPPPGIGCGVAIIAAGNIIYTQIKRNLSYRELLEAASLECILLRDTPQPSLQPNQRPGPVWWPMRNFGDPFYSIAETHMSCIVLSKVW